MTQNKAFLLIVLCLIIGMAGSVFFYRRAFKKTDIYYKMCDVEAQTVIENGNNVVALTFLIDTYAEDGTMLQHNAAATIGQKASDTLSSMSFHELCDSVSKDVTSQAMLVLLDRRGKKTSERKLSPAEWIKEFNQNPVSTNLQGNYLRFVIPGDGKNCRFAVVAKTAAGATISDTSGIIN